MPFLPGGTRNGKLYENDPSVASGSLARRKGSRWSTGVMRSSGEESKLAGGGVELLEDGGGVSKEGPLAGGGAGGGVCVSGVEEEAGAGTGVIVVLVASWARTSVNGDITDEKTRATANIFLRHFMKRGLLLRTTMDDDYDTSTSYYLLKLEWRKMQAVKYVAAVENF